MCFLADHNMANENLMDGVISGMDTIVIGGFGGLYDQKPCGWHMCKRCGIGATSVAPEIRPKQFSRPEYLRELKPRRLFDSEAEDDDDVNWL